MRSLPALALLAAGLIVPIGIKAEVVNPEAAWAEVLGS